MTQVKDKTAREICLKTIALLESLENNLIQVNTLRDDYTQKVCSRRNRQAFFTAFCLPLILFVIYGLMIYREVILGEHEMSFEQGLARFSGFLFVAIVLGTFVFSGYNFLWNRNKIPFSKKRILRRLVLDFQAQKAEIDQDTQRLLNDSLLQETEIPEKYLSICTLYHILCYLPEDGTLSLKEAIQSFETNEKIDVTTGASCRPSNKLDLPILQRVRIELANPFQDEFQY